MLAFNTHGLIIEHRNMKSKMRRDVVYSSRCVTTFQKNLMPLSQTHINIYTILVSIVQIHPLFDVKFQSNIIILNRKLIILK